MKFQMLKPLKQSLRKWWEGEFKVKDDVHFIHFYRDRSIWAYRIEAAFTWSKRNYWNLIFLAIGLLGLWIAL